MKTFRGVNDLQAKSEA